MEEDHDLVPSTVRVPFGHAPWVAWSTLAWRSTLRSRGLGPLGSLKQTLGCTNADNNTEDGAEREIESS